MYTGHQTESSQLSSIMVREMERIQGLMLFAALTTFRGLSPVGCVVHVSLQTGGSMSRCQKSLSQTHNATQSSNVQLL